MQFFNCIVRFVKFVTHCFILVCSFLADCYLLHITWFVVLLNLLHIVRSVQFAAHSFICLIWYTLLNLFQFVHCLICLIMSNKSIGGKWNKKNYIAHKKIKNKNLHMNSELQKFTTMGKSGKRAKRKKFSWKGESISHSFLHTHAHTLKHAYTCTHGHQVFIVYVLYSYQKLQQSWMTIISKKWPAFCDYVIVLEDVHTYIRFVFS